MSRAGFHGVGGQKSADAPFKQERGEGKFMPTGWEHCPVQYVKGVGPRRSELLAKLGIKTVRDLLYHFPVRIEDRSRIVPVADLKPGEYAAVKGSVQARGLTKSYRGYKILKVAVSDDTGVVRAVWFNQPYLEKFFPAGSEVVLFGKADYEGGFQIVNPAFEVLSGDNELLQAGCIVPIYPLTKDIYLKQLRRMLKEVFRKYGPALKEYLPGEIIRKNGLFPLPAALQGIHFPQSEEDWASARRRLIFDEFFLLQLALALRKKARGDGQGISHSSGGDLAGRFIRSLPFKLTGSQERVIGEIRADMARPAPMNRLVQGEVGSGKTVVAVASLLTAVEGGFQGAVLVPTEILAEQHFISMQKFLMPLGVKTALLVGGQGKKMRSEILDEIAGGDSDIVIGTHALLEEAVRFKNPGIIVIDEQHKFGVDQRDVLRRKGWGRSDLLMMSATPIPRSLALTAYGDLEVSTMGEVPSGGRRVQTYHVAGSRRGFMYAFIRQEVKKGRQAYFIYPVIDESEELGLRSAVSMAGELKSVFSGFTVGLLHGRMNSGEKEEVMRGFQEKETDILVCTSVVEVGIDVKNASVMVIEHPERFGLSQLHQMRGRVGRGEHPAYCFLAGEPAGEDARRRLEVLAGTSDGFSIAEEDLELRGPGQFLGTRQHGMPELRIGNIASDMELLQVAREEAFRLVADDPEMKSPENRRVKIFADSGLSQNA